jgi:hypothetical protein
MSLDPQWSEKLADPGGPQQPLRAGTVRNGILGDITWAITTDVTLRGRYASVFTWGQYLVESHPSFSDASIQTKKQAIYTLEKILALGTLRYQQSADVEAGTSGLVGKDRIDIEEILETDPIDLSTFSLREGSTGVQLTNTNRYYLFLRDRDTELGITGVGRELATAVDEQISDYRDRLVECLLNESVSIADLDRFTDILSFQTLYTEPETHSNELDVLRRVFLGLVSWDTNLETATLDPLPEELDAKVFPHLRYEVSDRRYEDELRDDVESEIIRLQRAWSLFMLQVTQEYQAPSGDGLYQLDPVAQTVFGEFRIVARLFWLQEFTAVMLRLQLWLLCEYLERALPSAVPRNQLFEDLLEDQINTSAAAAFATTQGSGEDPASQARVARELALYGQTPVLTPQIELSEPEGELTNLGELRSKVSSELTNEWDATSTSVNTSMVVRGIQSIVAPLDDVSPQDMVTTTWQQALGQSLSLLVMILERYRSITERHPVVGSYMQARHGSEPVSLPQLETYLGRYDDETPLTAVARDVVTDLVIDVHDRVVLDRLPNNNPNRLSFSYAADQDAYRYESGTSQLGRNYLRYQLMQNMLLDLGFITEIGDSAELTVDGEEFLALARRGGE